jgi:hypothetical protein
VTDPCGDFRYHQSLWRPIPALFCCAIGPRRQRPRLRRTCIHKCQDDFSVANRNAGDYRRSTARRAWRTQCVDSDPRMTEAGGLFRHLLAPAGEHPHHRSDTPNGASGNRSQRTEKCTPCEIVSPLLRVILLARLARNPNSRIRLDLSPYFERLVRQLLATERRRVESAGVAVVSRVKQSASACFKIAAQCGPEP